MTDLLLVTCSAFPDGEPGYEALDTALADRGVEARWVRWDDPDVDWESALVAVRSTWDYDVRLEEFLDWARSVPKLLNGADVFAWNTDKAYLLELDAVGVPIVPTISVDGEEDLPAAIAAWDTAVVKPRVGAGGRGVVVFDGTDGGPEGLDESALGAGPWIVQPLVASVRTEGEYSVYVIGGEPRSMVRKLPAGEEIRVHEEYGGSTAPVPRTAEASDLARRTVRAAEEILDATLVYARVDLLRLADGTLAVSELEVTEPGLYLEELPENGRAFAAAVAGVLARS
ncbi:glutathione synthase/RimK-type ligase-like ATP-grasp enzyme [Marmoricola sp. OAE513]|uniref:ATP-grasp domain-containing protein n=1 Tax=Marmoricola sp. OAE513 TaxID=2817894 RepID=UPI001AE34528